MGFLYMNNILTGELSDARQTCFGIENPREAKETSFKKPNIYSTLSNTTISNLTAFAI